MIEQAGPPSKQIQATKQVQEFLKDGDDVIIIGIFSGETDKAYQLYQEAGKEYFKILEDQVVDILSKTSCMRSSFIFALNSVRDLKREKETEGWPSTFTQGKKLIPGLDRVTEVSASHRT